MMLIPNTVISFILTVIQIPFSASYVEPKYKFCKLTITGFEYTGITGRSSTGYKCKPWASVSANDHASEKISDENFIDGSRNLAKAFCRNPDNSPKGPWCLTSNPDLQVDYCDIPLCHFPECRASSAGSEYGGVLSKSVSGLECHAWKTGNTELTSDYTFPEANFPSGSLGPEGRSCRNPNGNSAGPWCWVKPDHDAVEKEESFTDVEGRGIVAELCDVPFCNEPDCMTFVSGPSLFARYVAMPKGSQNLTFSFKPWLMDKWVSNKNGHFIKIFLSVTSSPYGPGFELRLPLYGKGLTELRYIGLGENREGIHLTMGAEESDDENYIMEKIINWSKYQITWNEESLAVYKLTDAKGNEVQPLLHLVYEPKESKTLREQEENLKNLNFISVSGQPSLWSGDCDESQCPVHTIIDSGLHHWERLRLAPTGTNVKFNVRGFESIGIELASSPVGIGPRIKILIGVQNHTVVSYGNKNKNQHIISYQRIEESSSEVIITYWEWTEFTVSLFGDRIGVYASLKDANIGQMNTLVETRHSSARLMRWFSPYSPHETVSHWTFFCSPQEEDEVPEALPPECITSLNVMATEKFMGSQWVSRSGMPCLPWVDPTVIVGLSAYKHHFPDISPWHAGNSCRNPTGGPLGPWCFRLMKDVKDSSGRMKIKGEDCGVRKCRYEDCRMSGIGTDYIGNLNQTITGRICQRWSSSSPHEVPRVLQNSSLFADLDIVKANNFCRNPSRNNAGPWCYTNDPQTPTDVCDIQDCVKPEACTVLVRGVGKGRLIYILPHWKTQGLSIWLKEWDPDHIDGLVFIFRPSEGERYYKLVIGADDNQKVKMFYKNESGEHLVKEKTVHYVVPAGRWGGFNIKIGHGSFTLSYKDDSSQHLFDWTHYYDEKSLTLSDTPFTPLFLTFTSFLGNTIGLHFHCWECHVEKTSTDSFTKLLPIRRPLNASVENATHLEFLLRGNGIALIPLMRQPGMGDYYGVTIGERKGNFTFLVRKRPSMRIKVIARASLPQKLLRFDKWTRFTISFNETNIRLSREEQILMDFRSNETLLFYWFSLGSENGEITWATNCNPPDIDGGPRDGGWSSWSPWQCSASCGGGVGRRERQCTNPTPNIFGRGCEGQPVSLGPCNRFSCGALSPRTVSRIRDNLRKKYAGVMAGEGKDVVLPCGNLIGIELMEAAMSESPNSTVGWTKDGSHLIEREGVLVLGNFDLELKNITPSDSGVYMCLLWQSIESKKTEKVSEAKGLKEKVKNLFRRLRGKPKEALSSGEEEQDARVVVPLALSVASLAVTRTARDRRPTVSVRETREVRLPCKAIPLGLVYGDLRLRWYLNGTLWKDYGFISPEVISEESLAVGKEHRGEWTCVVTQPDLQFSWTTNWILLEVKPPPNFFSMLMEDGLTAPIFGRFGSETSVIVAFFGILSFIFILICTSKVLIIRYCNSQKTE